MQLTLSTEQLNTIWDNILLDIKENEAFDSLIFNNYIKSAKLIKIEDNIAIVEVPWEINKQFINKYLDVLESRLDRSLDAKISVKIVTTEELNRSSSIFNNETNNNLNANLSDIVKITTDDVKKIFHTANNFSPSHNFDNFIEGTCNRKAFAAAQGAVISNEPNFCNPIFIYGNSGLGKTHLLHGMCNYLSLNRPEVSFLYIDGNDLISELIDATKNRTIQTIIDKISTVDYLLIDDIQHLARTNDTQEVFFSLYNKIISNGGQIILTSDVYPSELKSMNNRIVSRFTSGLAVCIDPPEFSTAVSIIQQKISISNRENLKITDDAIAFIAENYSKDVRELEGSLNSLLFQSVFLKQDLIDLDFAKEVLRGVPAQKPVIKDHHLSPRIIKKEVCDYYNITIAQIESKARPANISNPRKIAIYLCRELLDMSYEKIGKEFGNRDHSTIMSNYNSFVKLLKDDDRYQEIIDTLKGNLGF